jgi:hypothetical protein
MSIVALIVQSDANYVGPILSILKLRECERGEKKKMKEKCDKKEAR